MSTSQECEVAEKECFDELTTPLNACSLETYFPIPRDDDIRFNDSSNKPSDIPLIVGCYQLNDSPNTESEGDADDKTSSAATTSSSGRCGELRLHMISQPSTSKAEMKFGNASCSLQMESGILDGKWKRRKRNDSNEQTTTTQNARSPLFASACASGRIHIHSLTKKKCTVTSTPCLTHLASSEVQDDSGLCLSLAWNDYLNESDDQIVSSYSKGEVAIHQISYSEVDTNETTLQLEEVNRWKAHTLFGCLSEVWTCSFLRGVENVVLSGADDCSMKVWDIRQTQRPIHKVGDTEFEAGVTAISSHPSIENIFAVGSYDEHVRLYDYRKIGEPLSKISVGGGVWRIKWHPSNWNEDCRVHRCQGKVLVAAMHGGCRIVNFPSLMSGDAYQEEHDVQEADILSKFTAHESMAYGADWITFGSPTQEAVASCSFYDRKAFIWDSS